MVGFILCHTMGVWWRWPAWRLCYVLVNGFLLACVEFDYRCTWAPLTLQSWTRSTMLLGGASERKQQTPLFILCFPVDNSVFFLGFYSSLVVDISSICSFDSYCALGVGSSGGHVAGGQVLYAVWTFVWLFLFLHTWYLPSCSWLVTSGFVLH